MIHYEDFSLKIEPRRGDLYPVIVLRSPAGEGRSQFRLPFDPDDLGSLLLDLGEAVRGSAEKVVRETAAGATRTRPQQIGDQLFNALFSGPIRSLLDRSLGMLHGSNQGLHSPRSRRSSRRMRGHRPGGNCRLEPVSQRELEVLRLFSTELSAPEIAREWD